MLVCIFFNPFWLEHQRDKLQTQRLKFVSEKVLNRKTQFSEKKESSILCQLNSPTFLNPKVVEKSFFFRIWFFKYVCKCLCQVKLILLILSRFYQTFFNSLYHDFFLLSFPLHYNFCSSQNLCLDVPKRLLFTH